MVMNFSGAINAYHQSASVGKSGANNAPGADTSFSDAVKGFMSDSLDTVKQGEQAAAAGATGKIGTQEMIMAVEKASTTLETVMAIRDKVIGAYQEIMRTSV